MAEQSIAELELFLSSWIAQNGDEDYLLDAIIPEGGYVPLTISGLRAIIADLKQALRVRDIFRDRLANAVVAASVESEDADGFIAWYLMPTGPIHKAIHELQEYARITVRPGFDGRTWTPPATVVPSEHFDTLLEDGPAVPNEATRDAFRRLDGTVERRD